MPFSGMDPAEVTNLAGRIDSEAHNLDTIVRTLETLVGNLSANWQGADSTRFAATYHGQFKPQMTTAVQHLTALAVAARNNANDQVGTSS